MAEEEEIQALLDTEILVGRDSPPLSDEDAKEVVKVAADLLDASEGRVGSLIDTKAFPLKRPSSILEGSYIQWSTDALPTNPKFPYPLSAPKPDRHYGYPLGRHFDWTLEERTVLYHRTAQPYTQPTRDNIFPFLALELKSEATGGTLWVAENQGVGSGVHMVASQRWMLRQAFPSVTATDAVAFVGAVSPRMGVFYLVWYSDKKDRYVMSKLKTISFMEQSDIQRCRDLMNNIMDYGEGKRLLFIKRALGKLDPVPPHWKKQRKRYNPKDVC